jgi:hypothetical protein
MLVRQNLVVHSSQQKTDRDDEIHFKNVGKFFSTFQPERKKTLMGALTSSILCRMIKPMLTATIGKIQAALEF